MGESFAKSPLYGLSVCVSPPPPNSYVETLSPDAFGRWWGIGLVPLQEETSESMLPPWPLPRERTARRQPSANQEAGPHQTLHPPVPWSGTSSLRNRNREKGMPSVVICSSRLQGQGHPLRVNTVLGATGLEWHSTKTHNPGLERQVPM